MSYPFEKWHRRSAKTMRQNKFFKEHYFPKSQAWRRADNYWLTCAEQLALALNDFTNNTSLALAFEFIDSGKVVLFSGDAQIGSWLTWADLAWNVIDPNGAKRNVKVADLFPRVVFYKGSHHASYNGTLTGYVDGVGLEEMTHPDLVCVVPVDRAMSKEMGWDRTLPWTPLLTRLKRKNTRPSHSDRPQRDSARSKNNRSNSLRDRTSAVRRTSRRHRRSRGLHALKCSRARCSVKSAPERIRTTNPP